MYQRYQDRAGFLFVYIQEAHPQDGWTMERCASYEREQTSGRAHVGMAALLDFVARKP